MWPQNYWMANYFPIGYWYGMGGGDVRHVDVEISDGVSTFVTLADSKLYFVSISDQTRYLP